MKTALLIVLAVGALALLALLYHHRRAPSRGPVLHVRNEFEFTVHAPYKIAARFFGPEGERAGRAVTGIRTSCIRNPRRIFREQCSPSATATVTPIGSIHPWT